MLRKFLGRAQRLGHARGPSAAARTYKGAGRCGHMTNYLHVLHMRSMYNNDCGGGVQKLFSRKHPDRVKIL